MWAVRMTDDRPVEARPGEASQTVRARVLLVVDGTEVAEVFVADTYLRRARGMLWRRPLPDALLLVPGGSVHGVGMTAALDVALLSPTSGGRRDVLGEHRVHRTALLRPGGLVGSARGVRSTLEAPAGSFDRWGLTTGSSVLFRLAEAS